MLDIMRRKKRLKSILWLVIFSLALGMLLFFVPGMNVSNVTTDTSAATVDGRSIPMSELIEKYSQTIKYYSRSSGRNLDPETLKALGLSRQVLDSLIDGKVEETIADRLGIDVTEAEVQNAIETDPYLQDQGKFIGIERYKAFLAANDISIADFEKNKRLQVLDSKLHSIFADSLGISDRELKDEFSRANQETQVLYIVLKKDDFKKRVKPAEADLQAYFEAHKETYRVKEKRKIQYLLVRTSQIIPSIKVNEQEIQQEWDKTPHPETVKVAHILIKLSDPSKDSEAKANAERILKIARSGKDFGDLAKNYSLDAASNNQGGVLPPFSRGQGRVPKEFEDVAFSLKPGEISGVVRSEAGYHIIKLLSHDTPTLESSRNNIINTIQQTKAREQAKQKAEEAANMAEKQKDPFWASKNLGDIAEVRETKLFSKEDNAFQFDISEDLKNAAFELKEVNAIGKPVQHTLGYAIPKLLEVQMARPGEFSESRPQVEKDYIESKAKDLMQAEAKKISEEAGKQNSLEKVAKEMNWNVKTSQSFKYAGTPDPEIGANNPAFNSAAFDLPVGGVSSPIALMDNIAVLQVKSRTPFDEAAFEKEKSRLRERLLAAKQDSYFKDYLTKVTDELGKAGKIRINPKALDELPRYY
jgi:peptidyl-prolyl cis-trans isomerase D